MSRQRYIRSAFNPTGCEVHLEGGPRLAVHVESQTCDTPLGPGYVPEAIERESRCVPDDPIGAKAEEVQAPDIAYEARWIGDLVDSKDRARKLIDHLPFL